MGDGWMEGEYRGKGRKGGKILGWMSGEGKGRRIVGMDICVCVFQGE